MLSIKIKSEKTYGHQCIVLPAVIGVTPTLHRSLPNIELLHSPSLIAILVMFAPNGGKPCDGKSAPKYRVFFSFDLKYIYLENCVKFRGSQL